MAMPAAPRRLALFDLDGTLSRRDTFFPFVLGLLALACSPFSLLMALVLGMATVAVVSGVVGLAQASRPGVAGGVLAAVGLVLGLVSLGLVGLRYAGVDTAFGDELLPTLHDWLESLNGLVPTP